MPKLTTKARNALPDAKFALPAERKYPIENRSHAANAKARASQEVAKGKLSQRQEATIDRKADAVLKRLRTPKPAR